MNPKEYKVKYSKLLKELYEARMEVFQKAEEYFSRYFPKSYRPDLINELLDMSEKTILNKFKENKLSIDQASSLSSYYFGIFKNHVRNFSRKSKKEKTTESSENLSDLNSSREIEFQMLKEEVLKRMREEERFIFKLRLEGYKFDEIADKYREEFDYNIKSGTLRVKFFRAIKSLASQILESKTSSSL